MVSVSARFPRHSRECISSGNEWSQSPCHPVSGSTCPGLAIGACCGKGTAPGCAWCLRGAMLLRGFRLFGVALHREPKGTKRPFQDKFAKLFLTIAAELWLRGCPEASDRTFQRVARSVMIRLAEQLAKYICSLMRRAAALATPKTECLLYATYSFRPILSELIGAATETADSNRARAPSGPVKVTVTTQPHTRRHAGVNLVSGVSALLVCELCEQNCSLFP